MTFDINRYIEKRGKINFKRYLKYCWLKFFRKPLKKALLFLIKLLGWIILFILLFILVSYNEKNNIPQIGLIITLYLMIIIQYYTAKNQYKHWLLLAEYEEFYKRFCEQYRPGFFSYIFMYGIGLKYCDSLGLMACVGIAYCMDLWERRYLTNDIKQSMILEKLKL